MLELIQLSVSALSMGFVYALTGSSIFLIFNAAGVINFAQGALLMLGAYIGTTTLNKLGLPYFLAILLMIIIMVIIGFLFQRLAYYPLRNSEGLMFMIAGIGILVFMENFVQLLWGAAPISVRPLLSVHSINIGDLNFEPQSVMIIVITVAILLIENFFLKKTSIGKMTQAVAQDKEAASLMGISVPVMIAVTFINSTVLAGIAGVLVSPKFYVSIGLTSLLLKGMASCVIGGFGSALGPIIGGIIVGFTETFGARYISPQFRDAWAFLLMIAFLMIRPKGIFKERISEKV